MKYEISKGEYLISTNKELLDISLIHNYLSNESYWAPNIPKSVVEKSILNSLCFGLYQHTAQIG
jgi:hypothetical protein